LFKIQRGKQKNQRFMHKAFGKIKENQKIERVLIWGIPSSP
jgi:hypothetical protein